MFKRFKMESFILACYKHADPDDKGSTGKCRKEKEETRQPTS